MFVNLDVIDLDVFTGYDLHRKATILADERYSHRWLSRGVANYAMRHHGNEFNFQMSVLCHCSKPSDLECKLQRLLCNGCELAQAKLDDCYEG